MEINVRAIRQKKEDMLKVKIGNHGEELLASIIMVGNNDASSVYVRNKKKSLVALGIDVNIEILNEDCTYEDILATINSCEELSDGVLLQLPLPAKFTKEEENELINSIGVDRDIDCLTDKNLGRILGGSNEFLPCTVQACIDIIEDVNGGLELRGKNVLVIGRSKLVGLPLSVALTNLNATVTTIHSKSDIQSDMCSWMGEHKFDFVISATGVHGIINGEDLNERITFIDVGINRDSNGKLCGDLRRPELSYARYTPVPRGVGIMTVINVAENLLKLANR